MNFHEFPRISMNFKRRVKSFTLLELLIYAGILTISAGLIGGVFYTVSKANLRTQVNEELNNQLTRFEEIFRQKTESAKGINSIGGSTVNLKIDDVNKDPTEFTLTNNVVYLQEGTGDQAALNDSNKVKVISLSFTPTGPASVSITPTDNCAWNDQVGWIDFAYSGGNVHVARGAGDLWGLAYVLSDSHWISLNCVSTDSCYDIVNNPTGIDYKVSSDANGNLSDWAWSENFGWISFSCTTGGSNGGNICCSQNPPPCSDYGVTVATSTGEFDGYAYSENIGWISFNCKTGGADPVNICCPPPPTPCSDYKVQDLRLRTISVKVDITVQYNSEKPELAISRTNTFVFNIITPSR